MNDLERQLVDRIAAEGPITFAEFMRLALYDPEHGYYMSGSERTGWSGDFITSPELDPVFGILWGRAFVDLWAAAGKPDRFDVVEIGPGEGGFAQSLLTGAPEELSRSMRLTLVEIDPERRARQQEKWAGREVTWVSSIEEIGSLEAGVVFANEVLDNQPVHVLRNRAGGFQELHVDASDDGLVEIWLDCTDEDLVRRVLSSDSPPGAEVEISLAAEELALASLVHIKKGAAIFVDYGQKTTTDAGTLASYSSGGASTRTLTDPGTKDLTAHVDWSAIAQACLQDAAVEIFGPLPQLIVLAALGAHGVDDELKSEYRSLLESGRGAEAVAALSRRQALGALMDPGGLGGLSVLVALRNLEAPDWLQKKTGPKAGQSRDA